MSQRLPALPNLDHLKKQAKDVLRVSRYRHPAWRLADAQHALARGYGFPCWADLKFHIEAVRTQSGAASRSSVRDAGTSSDAGGRPPNATAQERRGRSSHPIVGTWAARPTTSSEEQGQDQAWDVVVEFELTGDTITVTQIATDPAGRESAAKMVIQADGHEHPVQFGDAFTGQARWIDARILETIVRDGTRIVAKGTYEVSADGQSLVVSAPTRRMVFERVSSTFARSVARRPTGAAGGQLTPAPSRRTPEGR